MDSEHLQNGSKAIISATEGGCGNNTVSQSVWVVQVLCYY